MLVFCFKDALHRAASGTYILFPCAYTAQLFCFHIRIVFRHPARLARSTVVTLLKHPVKKLLIKEAMPLHDLLYRIVRVQQILIDIIEPHLIYIAHKRSTGALLKEPAEVFPVEPQFIRRFLQRHFFPVVMIHIRTDLLQPLHIARPRLRCHQGDRFGKMFHQTCQQFQNPRRAF